MIGKIETLKKRHIKKTRLGRRRKLEWNKLKVNPQRKKIKQQVRKENLMQFTRRRKTILTVMKLQKATRAFIQSIRTKAGSPAQEINRFNRATCIFLEVSFNSRKRESKSLIKAILSRDCPTLRKPKSWVPVIIATRPKSHSKALPVRKTSKTIKKLRKKRQ